VHISNATSQRNMPYAWAFLQTILKGINRLSHLSNAAGMPLRWPNCSADLSCLRLDTCACSEIEAKTRAALGQTDINDMYDKEAIDTDAEDSDALSELEA